MTAKYVKKLIGLLPLLKKNFSLDQFLSPLSSSDLTILKSQQAIGLEKTALVATVQGYSMNPLAESGLKTSASRP
jgi:hypothetical protein